MERLDAVSERLANGGIAAHWEPCSVVCSCTSRTALTELG
jgi:hypothetical protein